MSDEYFYAKKGGITIKCDEDEITVTRWGTTLFYGRLIFSLILLAGAIAFTVVVLKYPHPTRNDFLLSGLVALVLDIVAIGILVAVLCARETARLDAEGLHLRYNGLRRSLSRFIPLRELGDFVCWTTRHEEYHSLGTRRYDTYEIHARTLGNRVRFAHCRRKACKDYLEMIADRMCKRLEKLRAVAINDPQAERCLLQAGKTLAFNARGNIPPLGIARYGKSQNLIPIAECRWHDEIDDYGDLVLSDSKSFNFENLIMAGLGTAVFLSCFLYWCLNASMSDWSNLFENYFGFISLFLTLAFVGSLMTFWFLYQVVDRFHRSRWCFSKNGSVEHTSRFFGIPRRHYYENGMQFAFMVINDDYGTKKYDEYRCDDNRWELVFYDAAKATMFRIGNLYRGEAHWLADQLLKFCNPDS